MNGSVVSDIQALGERSFVQHKTEYCKVQLIQIQLSIRALEIWRRFKRFLAEKIGRKVYADTKRLYQHKLCITSTTTR